MRASDTALCFRHELKGCVQTETCFDRQIDLILDPKEAMKEGWLGQFSLLLAEYEARVVGYKHTQEYIIYSIAPLGHDYRNPHRRAQISLKLERSGDADIIEYLKTVDNVQGLIKALLREHIAAIHLMDEDTTNDHISFTGD